MSNLFKNKLRYKKFGYKIIRIHKHSLLVFIFKDLIIYMFLWLQQFLSMKLSTVNPSLDFNIDSFFPKEVNIHVMYLHIYSIIWKCSQISHVPNPISPLWWQMFLASAPNYPGNCVSSEMINSTYPLNELLQMGINPDLGEPRRSISTPLSIPETILDSFCFNVIFFLPFLVSFFYTFCFSVFLQCLTLHYSKYNPLQPMVLSYKTFTAWSFNKTEHHHFPYSHLQV